MTIECQRATDIKLSPTISEEIPHEKNNNSTQSASIKIQITESESLSCSPLDSIRCTKCKKKLRLTQQFQCKCNAFFCSAHRYADTHSCTFDFKKEWQNALNKKNIKVNGIKIEKI